MSPGRDASCGTTVAWPRSPERRPRSRPSWRAATSRSPMSGSRSWSAAATQIPPTWPRPPRTTPTEAASASEPLGQLRSGALAKCGEHALAFERLQQHQVVLRDVVVREERLHIGNAVEIRERPDASGERDRVRRRDLAAEVVPPLANEAPRPWPEVPTDLCPRQDERGVLCTDLIRDGRPQRSLEQVLVAEPRQRVQVPVV